MPTIVGDRQIVGDLAGEIARPCEMTPLDRKKAYGGSR